jgi:NAD(P)H-dependent FMN reductase
MKNILVLNGSPHGSKGNCNHLIRDLQIPFEKKVRFDVVHLAEKKTLKSVLEKIKKAEALIFVTGTYWDSWGSPLQRLLEEMTELEGTNFLLGKPCAVFVLMHSVGGKAVLSRLQGVLSTLGFLIPPMSGMVYSLASDLALRSSKSPHKDDFWDRADSIGILENVLLAMEVDVKWKSWPVDRKNFRKRWI